MIKSFIKGGLCFLCLSVAFFSFSQTSKLQIKGDQFLKKGKYEEGIEYFHELDEKVKMENSLYDYYLGRFYYSTPDQKENAIPHLEEYLRKTDSLQIKYREHDHVYYILGKLNHLTYNFIEAKFYYKEYLKLVEEKPFLSMKEREAEVTNVEREIEQCNYGEIAVKNPRNVYIENLGDGINTPYPDYAPVVSQDEKLLIFTSRRPAKGNKYVPGEGYYEDIYQAELIEGSSFEKRIVKSNDSIRSNHVAILTEFKYENFKRMENGINSDGHDAGIQLGENDQTLFFYRDSDIWQVSLSDSTESEPEKMGRSINSAGQESSIFISHDGTKLFIVSDRSGGFGGRDIYVSEKQENGSWGKAVNLGPNINSKYNEDAPYLDADGKTLFFSSAGNSSIGGYDIFRSRLEEDGWSFPINLGYPINTTSDDIYFSMTGRSNRGYYSSGSLDGKGGMDLYRITFSDERDPVAELVGAVKLAEDLEDDLTTTITMTSVDEKETISQSIDSLNGYFLLLGHGKEYDMSIKTDGFAPFQRRFKIPEQEEYFQLHQEVHQEKLYNKNGIIIGQKITVYNAMGNETSSDVLYDSLTINKLNFIKMSLNYEGNMEALTDVKFYVSEDSLKRLMDGDTSLAFTFDANTNVSFIEPYGDRSDPESYRSYNVTLNTKNFLEMGINIKDGSDLAAAEAENVHNVNGLFYTIQIGVYANPVTPNILLNIKPLNSQITDKGYIRYTTGKFESVPQASTKLQEMLKKGVPDAYVTAYYNGNRITIEESKELLREHGRGILFNSTSNSK